MTERTPPDDHHCALCPRPRDVYRSRLYRAQQRPEVPAGPSLDLEACRGLAEGVVASDWWVARFGYRHAPKVTTMRRRTRRGSWPVAGDCAPWAAHIRLLPSARCVLLLAHELAHIAQPHGTSWHGLEFATCFLALVRRLMGAAAALSLREAFEAERVPYLEIFDLTEAAA